MGHFNNAVEMMNQFNRLSESINHNDIIRGREIFQIMTYMTDTINAIRNDYINQIQNLNREIQHLRDEVTRLNNFVQIPSPPPIEPDIPEHTKQELCSELLEYIEETKYGMQEDTYITLLNKLMEIYHR